MIHWDHQIDHWAHFISEPMLKLLQELQGKRAYWSIFYCDNGSFKITSGGCDLRHPTGMVTENMLMTFLA